MLKLENISILNGVVTCIVTCQDGTKMDLSVSVSNWDNPIFSDSNQVLDACHARNMLYRTYIENNGNLPKSLDINFG